MPYNTTLAEDRVIKAAVNASYCIQELLAIITRLDGEVERLSIETQNKDTLLDTLRGILDGLSK